MIAFVEWNVRTTEVEHGNAKINRETADAYSVVKTEEALLPKGVDKAAFDEGKAAVKAKKIECFGKDWETKYGISPALLPFQPIRVAKPLHTLCAGDSIRRALMRMQGRSLSEVLARLHRLQV